MEPVQKAKQMIKKEQASCVIIKNNKIIHSIEGQGVNPLISIYENEPEVLQNSFVLDKIIGKAAAVIIILGGAEKIYGEIISVSAYELFHNQNHTVNHGKMIDYIVNRSGNGMCPLEKSVLEINNLETAYHKLKETLNKLKNNNS